MFSYKSSNVGFTFSLIEKLCTFKFRLTPWSNFNCDSKDVHEEPCDQRCYTSYLVARFRLKFALSTI